VRGQSVALVAPKGRWRDSYRQETPRRHRPLKTGESGTATFVDCRRHCGVRLSLLCRHTPPAPDILCSTPFTSRSQARRPSITPKTGLTSRLSLARSPHPCKSTSRFHSRRKLPVPGRSAADKHQAPNTQAQDPKHVNRARRTRNNSSSVSSACLPPSHKKQGHCLSAAAPTRPTTALPPLALHTNTAHRKAPLPHTQTARCLALRALRSASIPMAP